MKPTTLSVNREVPAMVHNGWTMLVLAFLLLLADVALFVWSLAAGIPATGHPYVLPFVVSLLGFPAWIVFVTGFFTLQPNEARVLVLFGAYKGTVREAGFHWGNPFYSNGSGTRPNPVAWWRTPSRQRQVRSLAPVNGNLSLAAAYFTVISLR